MDTAAEEAPDSTTVTVPLMELCISQKYWNVPVSANVNEYWLFTDRIPLSHTPEGELGVPEVEVWGAPSWFVQVTNVPTLTVRVSSWKLTIFEATAWGSDAGGGVVGVGAGGGTGVGGTGVAVGGTAVAVGAGAAAAPGSVTVTVPVIELCMLQKYWNVPASVNVNEHWPPRPRFPLSHTPDRELGVPDVTVCVARSWLVQVTVVPTETDRLSSTKLAMLEASLGPSGSGAVVAVGAGGTAVAVGNGEGGGGGGVAAGGTAVGAGGTRVAAGAGGIAVGGAVVGAEEAACAAAGGGAAWVGAAACAAAGGAVAAARAGSESSPHDASSNAAISPVVMIR